MHGLVAYLDAFVVGRDLLRPRVVRPKAFKDCCDSETADRELRGAVEESATADVAMLVFVKEVQQLLRVIACNFAFHAFSLCRLFGRHSTATVREEAP